MKKSKNVGALIKDTFRTSERRYAIHYFERHKTDTYV